jgi:hypothetical protein
MDIVYLRRITRRAMLTGPKVAPATDRVGPNTLVGAHDPVRFLRCN